MLDFAHASGSFGQPTLNIESPVYVEQPTFHDETVGDGMRVTSTGQDVQFSISVVNGATGQSLGSAATQPLSVGSWDSRIPGLGALMMCATEGSRIVGAIPSSGLPDQTAQGLGVSPGQSLVFTIDLAHVYRAAADGASQYNDRRGMPSVVLAPDGRPGVIVPDSAAPTDVAVELLKKGDGPAIGSSDAARVHYTAVDWKTRKVTDSTWESGASVAVTPDSRLGFAAQLQGVTVGSQLLVVVPAAAGSGSATVYVVDILGIDPASSAR